MLHMPGIDVLCVGQSATAGIVLATALRDCRRPTIVAIPREFMLLDVDAEPQFERGW